MNIQASNLMFALRMAINDQRKAEKEHGFTRDSTMVVGWENLYNHLQRGGQITIVPSQTG